jgi:hypothetical protein
MNWSRKHTIVAGAGLIALTNAVALLGVVYNRAGTPEATLRLTQRELGASYVWHESENSGRSMVLRWRVLNEPSNEATSYYNWRYGGSGGTPSWLDEAKMRSLGFAMPASDSERDLGRYQKQLARDVFLVLELDGPAYRRSLELATEYAAREEARLKALPGDKGLNTRAKNAREALDWETRRNTRLFIVDAGLDAAALRAKYSDTTRYAIVHGQVGPVRRDARNAGAVSALAIESIHVPFALRALFDKSALSEYDERTDKQPFEATVAFGKRLEPWIIDAQKK